MVCSNVVEYSGVQRVTECDVDVCRQFLVVDSSGRRVTGTTHPRMFLIQTHITPKGHLTLDAPDMDTFLLHLPITYANPYANK